jgi:hypothetical protein
MFITVLVKAPPGETIRAANSVRIVSQKSKNCLMIAWRGLPDVLCQ